MVGFLLLYYKLPFSKVTQKPQEQACAYACFKVHILKQFGFETNTRHSWRAETSAVSHAH